MELILPDQRKNNSQSPCDGASADALQQGLFVCGFKSCFSFDNFLRFSPQVFVQEWVYHVCKDTADECGYFQCFPMSSVLCVTHSTSSGAGAMHIPVFATSSPRKLPM